MSKSKVELELIGSSHYHPPDFPGLVKVVRFPDEEFKSTGIPNGTVWIFSNDSDHYVPEIFANDVGCGMQAILTDGPIDPKETADQIYDMLKGQNILGRGNHFVDICTSPFSSEGNLIFFHSDGKQLKNEPPKTLEEAVQRQNEAQDFRQELADTFSKTIGFDYTTLGDWPHNTIEVNGGIIYRKGVISVRPNEIFPLPSHLGAKILFYALDPMNMPPYDSMPHATGRSGPRGEMKVSLDEATELRRLVYIPSGIPDTALRSEHPSCYRDSTRIVDTLGSHIIPVGESTIISYVGKV